ncbi:MAG: hypothetical protein WDO16_11915 [Bacteroidota bacterium]
MKRISISLNFLFLFNEFHGSSGGSFCVQYAGVTAFDIRNYNRIVNTVVDIGPYEFNSAILPVHLTRFSGRPMAMSIYSPGPRHRKIIIIHLIYKEALMVLSLKK